ncbi:MAG: HTTM domain-containing protein [Flavobacteriales bacterium]|nr:HTTM domain-containing protein [Flavobacteriales bacterium]
MFISITRFYLKGWIEAQYINPDLHFKYFGFYWIPDLSSMGYYVMFGLIALSSLGIAFGALYRISTVVFFLAFTYMELVDATYYLNHYYFVSLVGLILIFLPAHRQHSIDALSGLTKRVSKVSAATISLLKFQLGLVYFLAGVAKLNADWLLEAMPLAIWLPAQAHLPIIGELMTFKATAFAFSWAGAAYDLAIPFVLLSARLRWGGYAAVIAFHLMTWSFFQIGMFPFIMIGATLIFFSSDFHLKMQSHFGLKQGAFNAVENRIPVFALNILTVFFAFQVLFPFRYLMYSGNPYWTEQGFRFGWRVMLIEKAGYAQFKVSDEGGNELWVDNSDFLTAVQEKMLSTQPDLMLQYADHLKTHYEAQGVSNATVKADVHVTFNGRPSQPFIDPTVDLAELDDNWGEKAWILPLALERG